MVRINPLDQNEEITKWKRVLSKIRTKNKKTQDGEYERGWRQKDELRISCSERERENLGGSLFCI